MPKASTFGALIASQVIDSDSVPLITNAGENKRVPISEMRNVVGPGWSSTVNAYNEAGLTDEDKIQAAINRAVSVGAARVFVPTSMIPYDASLVTFHTDVQMVREGGSFDVYDLIAYGAIGDGLNDDTAALEAWYAAIVDSGTGVIPFGRFRHTSTLLWDKNVTVEGYGPASSLKPDVGVSADGIIVQSTTSGQSYRVKLRDFSICNDVADCCRNGIVINRVQVSQVDIHLEVAADQYAAWVNGCLIGNFRFVRSGNGAFPFTRAFGEIGTVRVTYDGTPNFIANNNMLFNVCIEGGNSGLVIEDQLGQGNIEIRGVIEGLSGGAHALYAKGCSGLNLHDLHIEANACEVTLEDCSGGVIGPAYIQTDTGGELNLIGCFDMLLHGVAVDSINVDSACKRIFTNVFKYNTNGSGAITDTGKNIVQIVPIINAANGNNTTSVDAEVGIPTAGFFQKGAFVPNNNIIQKGTGGSKYQIMGYVRLTTGSSHTINVDWSEVRTLTGT